MIVWGLRADRSGERIWSTALPLALTSLSFALTLLTGSLWITLVLLSLVLLGNYAIKARSSPWRPRRCRQPRRPPASRRSTRWRIWGPERSPR